MKHSETLVIGIAGGSGSGKTTDLCHIVDEAVRNGLDPARILATTFTKKAAAELKGRMQAKLLAGTADRLMAGRNAERQKNFLPQFSKRFSLFLCGRSLLLWHGNCF